MGDRRKSYLTGVLIVAPNTADPSNPHIVLVRDLAVSVGADPARRKDPHGQAAAAAVQTDVIHFGGQHYVDGDGYLHPYGYVGGHASRCDSDSYKCALRELREETYEMLRDDDSSNKSLRLRTLATVVEPKTWYKGGHDRNRDMFALYVSDIAHAAFLHNYSIYVAAGKSVETTDIQAVPMQEFESAWLGVATPEIVWLPISGSGIRIPVHKSKLKVIVDCIPHLRRTLVRAVAQDPVFQLLDAPGKPSHLLVLRDTTASYAAPATTAATTPVAVAGAGTVSPMPETYGIADNKNMIEFVPTRTIAGGTRRRRRSRSRHTRHTKCRS